MKLERILGVLGEHSVEMGRHGLLHEQNAAQLVVHIARTNALEKHMASEHKGMKKDLEIALTPIKFFKSVKWLAVFVTTIGAAIVMLKSLGIVK